MGSYLIKGGNVLIFTDEKKATFPQLDILVEGQQISKIGSNLSVDAAEASTEVIDASGYIVTPGFIDGHRHVFQSQLRSTVSDHSLLGYGAHLLLGRMVFLDAEDMYLSQLAGAVEAISCGVTTVMDHSHVVTSPEHARRCIKATLESGIRSIYCMSPFGIPISVNPLTFPDMATQHAGQVELFKSLSAEKPLGGPVDNDGRLTLGLGLDTVHQIPVGESKDILTYAKEHSIPVTMHDVIRFALPAMKFLREHPMPSLPSLTLSHACEPDAEILSFVKDHKIGIVSTPESEMAMGHGQPSAFDFYRFGIATGLGIDSPAICSGDLFTVMRLALQERRMLENSNTHSRGKIPESLKATTSDVLYMATLGGAEAIHMEKEIGSLEVGKKADIVLIRTDGPSMVSSVDFGGALVTHCSAADVDTVLVNGEIVKREGKLLRVDWDGLKDQLRQNRAILEERWKHVDWERNQEELKNLWGLQPILE
ncbi:uncharacterized protein Z518_03026 [Rhinocladiella mackenziei CBS 650.93]|uniref:Rhinocladiella mackenziei CBS 650.93 unplaced genomic scaffold supercont1.2, whole genome shotgun sequence n=1 Tax=Rhinocladiella mackenziei CBS 650.93 TaxID=1442369 RepID=A0A0D2JGA6_9EURO|nr:uncharacterized protein Z518_03026 [Rhinocladiella mackenziei CBS 650.93]KIX08370.1 hypothetical protein Z518_03026 [Rhinocladiella mackenziei CBS 650.93]